MEETFFEILKMDFVENIVFLAEVKPYSPQYTAITVVVDTMIEALGGWPRNALEN